MSCLASAADAGNGEQWCVGFADAAEHCIDTVSVISARG